MAFFLKFNADSKPQGVSMLISYIYLALGLWLGQVPGTTNIAGVYKGTPIFIQNAFDPQLKTFCIESISINDRPISINKKVSAIKIDFDGIDLYTPIVIKILHKTTCTPVIINPDAIFYHNVFSFAEIILTDSTLVWKTEGEKVTGSFIIEKIQFGLWQEETSYEAVGKFEGAIYTHYPKISEGSNKYRIKYVFPDGNYLYSREIDFHFYPEPVTLTPQKTKSKIFFSRSAAYKIYDPGNKVILEGSGTEADVSSLPKGSYVIYFNEEDPGWFIKE